MSEFLIEFELNDCRESLCDCIYEALNMTASAVEVSSTDKSKEYIVGLWLDGYQTEEDEEEACMIFMESRLSHLGSYKFISKVHENN